MLHALVYDAYEVIIVKLKDIKQIQNLESPMAKQENTNYPSHSTKRKSVVKIPDGTTLILSDVHVPYHDVDALECALSHIENPTNIVLNGDAVDFFSVSRWDKDPDARDLAGELQASRQFLMHLRERFPETNIFFKIGNHEERWETYLWRKGTRDMWCT